MNMYLYNGTLDVDFGVASQFFIGIIGKLSNGKPVSC